MKTHLMVVVVFVSLACAGSLISAQPQPNPQKQAVPLLDPETNAAAHLYISFLNSGWASDEAVRFTCKALGLDDPAEGVENCYVCPATIQYCDDNGTPRTRSVWFNAQCYVGPNGDGEGGLKECLERFQPCPEANAPWFELNPSGNCGSLPNNAGCIRLRIYEPIMITCGAVGTPLGCNCFTETNPLDCEDIEIVCCPDGGCQLVPGMPICPDC